MISYSEMEVHRGADIALKNRLYVSGWSLSCDLKRYRRDPIGYRHVKIVLAYDGEIPVGVVAAEPNGTVQVFVRKSYRRRGIASGMIRSHGIKVVYCGDGIDGSYKFWDKVRNEPTYSEYFKEMECTSNN